MYSEDISRTQLPFESTEIRATYSPGWGKYQISVWTSNPETDADRETNAILYPANVLYANFTWEEIQPILGKKVKKAFENSRTFPMSLEMWNIYLDAKHKQDPNLKQKWDRSVALLQCPVKRYDGHPLPGFTDLSRDSRPDLTDICSKNPLREGTWAQAHEWILRRMDDDTRARWELHLAQKVGVDTAFRYRELDKIAQALCDAELPEEGVFEVAKKLFHFVTMRGDSPMMPMGFSPLFRSINLANPLFNFKQKEISKGYMEEINMEEISMEEISKGYMEEIRKVAGEPPLPEGFQEELAKAEAFVQFLNDRFGVSEAHAIGEFIRWRQIPSPERWDDIYITEPTWSIEEYENARA